LETELNHQPRDHVSGGIVPTLLAEGYHLFREMGRLDTDIEPAGDPYRDELVGVRGDVVGRIGFEREREVDPRAELVDGYQTGEKADASNDGEDGGANGGRVSLALELQARKGSSARGFNLRLQPCSTIVQVRVRLSDPECGE
jgi:hypothetical protein